MLRERSLIPSVIGCFTLALVATWQNSSKAGQLFGGGSRTRSLYSIDLETGFRTTRLLTGSANDVLNATGQFRYASINGLAYNSSDGCLYATTRMNTPSPGGLPDELSIFRIDPTTFEVQQFQIAGLPARAPHSEPRVLSGFEYDSRRDVFWATDTGAGFGQLIRIDAQTFQAKVAGYLTSPTPSSNRFVSGLAYDHASDTLFGVDDGLSTQVGTKLIAIAGGSLDSIESTPLPGDAVPTTEIGAPGLGMGLTDVDSLAFDPVRRQLYAIEDLPLTSGLENAGQLFRIDPATGLAAAIGAAAGNAEFYQGLAFIPPAPLDLDGNDFLAWQRGLGESPNATFEQGDFSGDGKVDSYDLDLWKYSMSYGSVDAGVVTIPECATTAPLVLAMLAVTRLRLPGRAARQQRR